MPVLRTWRFHISTIQSSPLYISESDVTSPPSGWERSEKNASAYRIRGESLPEGLSRQSNREHAPSSKKISKSNPYRRAGYRTPQTPSLMPMSCRKKEGKRCSAVDPDHDDTVLPSQSGMVTPFFRFRSTSMRPHLSSHSLPFVLYVIFQGSSKAENLPSD